MAAKTTLVLQMTDTDNNLLEKSITYANPAASNSVLANFSEAVVGLTTNTYVDTKRIDTISLNEAIADETSEETSTDEGGGE